MNSVIPWIENSNFKGEIRMDAVNATAVNQSIQAVNDVLKMAGQETTEAAAKMVKVAAEMKVGPGSGNGNSIDYYA
jgi:hypothetical protein